MRAVIQRVTQASVTVDAQITGQIAHGLLVLLGVEQNDQPADLQYMVKKVIGLRIFEDDQGKMNLPIKDVGGAMLVVSQFTLLGDTRKGNRPSFINAAPPEYANQMYQEFVATARQQSIDVQTGTFQANMQVALVNDGPVTIVIDSRKRS